MELIANKKVGSDIMAKIKNKFVCQECGYETPKWMGKCPECGVWNSFVEEIENVSSKLFSTTTNVAMPLTVDQIEITEEERFKTGLNELDRVLGGGIVKGSLILVGGDPGIGKSTLLLQVSKNISLQGYKVFYVSGEESEKQIKLRAQRLNVKGNNVYIVAETNLSIIEKQIESLKPDIVIVDSIQTMFKMELQSAPGSVSQVRESTLTFMRLAKGLSIPMFIVGHVTKEGAIAGPRVLEHMVDTVLYFEGERHHTYRVIRSVKNRFGSTNEIGIFEMKGDGLREVLNPSEVMLSGRPEMFQGLLLYVV